MTSEVVPARISTTINVGSADISSMMVQAHIDGLKKEEAEILAEFTNNHNEMDALHNDIVARFQAALDKKRDVLDPLVTALNALLGGKHPVCAVLCPSLASTKERHRFWSQYTSDSAYVFRPFKEAKMKSRWIFAAKDSVPEADEDGAEEWEEGDGYYGETVQISTRIRQEKLQKLTITVNKALRDRINEVLLRKHSQSKRLLEIRAELKDTPNLERKVRAALTRQLLASQPDLMRQVNAALTSSGGKLLLEVQE